MMMEYLKVYAELVYSDFKIVGKGLFLDELKGYLKKHKNGWLVMNKVTRKTYTSRIVSSEASKILSKTKYCHGLEVYAGESVMTEEEVLREFFRRRCGVCRHVSLALTKALQERGIQSKIVYGFSLDKSLEPSPHAWVAYYDEELCSYVAYDPYMQGPLVPVEILSRYKVYMKIPKKLTVITIKNNRVRII